MKLSSDCVVSKEKTKKELYGTNGLSCYRAFSLLRIGTTDDGLPKYTATHVLTFAMGSKGGRRRYWVVLTRYCRIGQNSTLLQGHLYVQWKH